MKTGKYISLLLVIAIVFSCIMPMSAFAAESIYQLVADDVVITGTETEDITVDVYFQAKANHSITAIDATWMTTEVDTDYFTLRELEAFSKGMTMSNVVADGKVVWMDTSGGVLVEGNTTIWKATYTVDPSTPAGNYVVGFAGSTTKVKDEGGTEGVPFDLTATIEVKEAVASQADYEIYYTLNGVDTESPADKYHEYGIGDDVVATVKLKNNTANAMTLQAYDIYLDYNAGLKYKEHSMTGAAAYAADKETVFNAAEDTVVEHIQAVSEGFTPVALPANNELILGTITFTIDKDNADVKYDTPLDIGFKVAADATNTAKAKDVTNFSVGGATEGDKVSYYPMETDDILGAEVNTTYTVQFDKNGGEGTMNAQTFQYGIEQALIGNTFTREGWEFTGWNTAAIPTEENKGVSYSDEENVTNPGNIILYAQWEQNTFTVKWHDANGNEITSATQTVESGSKLTVTGEKPEKASTESEVYTFIGWNIEQNATKAMDLTDYTVTGNLSFYPVYTSAARQYTITFVDEDGTVLKEGALYDYGTKADDIVKPDDPTKDATAQYTYTFAGWTPAIEKVTGDATYTATYDAAVNEYTIKFVDEDGTTLSEEKYTYGTAADDIEKPADPTKAAENGYSYTFAGWTPAIEKVTGDATYTATYTKAAIRYTITLDPNGENVIVTGDGWTKGEDGKYTKEYTVEESIALPEATLSGKSFGGWQLEANAEGWTAGNYRGTVEKGNYGNVELKAVWTDKPLSVEGSGVKGTVTVSNADIASGSNADEGDTINITLTPANGYEHTGTTKVQYTYTNDKDETVTVDVSKGADGKYSFTVPYDVQNVDGTDITVNVTFTAINYTITYELDGGAVDGTNPVKYTIESDDIALVAPTKEGYTFAGWTGTDLNEATKNVTIAKGSTGAREYTATWTAVDYTITYMDGESEITGLTPATYTIEAAATLPTKDTVTKNGYTFEGWYTDKECTDANKVTEIAAGSTENKTFYAKWNLVNYTITFQMEDGTLIDTKNYTIESTDELGDATREYYTFSKWEVKTESGKWTVGTYNADTSVEGYYGNVIMIAQWTRAAEVVVEEYKYAYTGYYLIRVEDNLADGKVYKFGEQTMYYIDDANYNINNKGVYYTLIPATSLKTENGTVKMELTDAAYNSLQADDGNKADLAIDYSGDINDDGVLNIADANIVYQMTAQGSKGAYYADTQLGIEQRLSADMNKTVNANTDEHRGSIADVQVIVNKINGVVTNNG